MASVCKRKLSTTEKRGVRHDLDLWRSKLIRCVGVHKILDLLFGTRILEDLRLFRNYKPASVSNWSFDENCLFCCLRRKKVKEHVVALNNKIVESGGKPLLGKDNSNINRLEWQVEEFLNAVLHRKDYTPRIPDPHIPVVSCDTMQQMIGQLMVHYTSVSNSQDSPQHNGNMDQSPLKASCVTSTTMASAAATPVSAQNPVLSKLLMTDQDAPLDLSVKKVKQEFTEQDGVLDLSMKKNRSSDHPPLRSPPMNVPNPLITRDCLDASPTKVWDLQSASTLEQFMANLCLHHQRQVVDAFGFLQTEVKAVASSSHFQAISPPPAIPEKPMTSGSSHAAFEEQSRRSEETRTLSAAISPPMVQESTVVKSHELPHVEQPMKTEESLTATVKPLPSVDVEARVGEDVLLSSDVAGAECSTNVQPKCPTLLIVKNGRSGNHEAKNLSEEGSDSQHPNTGTLGQGPCTSDTQLQASSSESDIVQLSSSSVEHEHTELKHCSLEKSLSASSKASERPCTGQSTSNVISTVSTRTARKSRRASHSQRESSGCHVVRDPDIGFDIVYVGKPITECGLQSRHCMLPRKNARKSTRGHLYIGNCCELKTVRTLSRKSAENGSGNCPVPMPEMTTSVTPKQALTKPDGVPPVDMPCTGDCMETVMNKNPSDQPVHTEVPGDVFEMASEDLIVETTQTDQIQRSEQSSVLSIELSDPSVQQDLNAEIHDGVADYSDTVYRQASATDCNEANINVPIQALELASEETPDAPISDVIGELETGQDENVATEALLSPVSLDVSKDDALDAEDTCVGKELKDQDAITGKSQTETVEQTETFEMQETDQNLQSQILCESESNIKAGDITPTQDKVDKSEMSVSVEEAATKEQPEECKEEALIVKSPESMQKVVAKHAVSDRCLRSRASKGIPEEMPLPDQIETLSDSCDKTQNTPEFKRPLKNAKLKHAENVQGQDDSCSINTTENQNLEKAQSPVVAQKDTVGITENMVCTRKKQKLMIMKETESDKEQNALEISSPKDESKVEESPGNAGVTPPRSDDSPGKSLRAFERMPLRNSSRLVEQPFRKALSPVKNISKSSERMPLRSRGGSGVDQPVGEDSSSSPTTGQLEKQGRMPLRSRDSHNAVQVSKDIGTSPNRSSSEIAARMPLRSKKSSTTDQLDSRDSPNVSKDESNSVTEHPSSEDSLTSKKSESSGHMPLRSGNASAGEQPKATLTESPGRMSLRRSNLSMPEKDSCSTPPKTKNLPQRPQKTSKISPSSSAPEVEPVPNSPSNTKLKNDKHLKDQIKVSPLPDNSGISVNLPTRVGPVGPSPSKFLEALNGEENQHLILDLNTKFDKMQKGWVQMDKEGQPAPKPKNKGDRLKEIWKSKKRIRKPRSLEQQKFSPVQMLFMKSFDLPSICRWFLQSTETKSLVIVKKVNTRLPSETQLCFHTSAAVPGSSNGVFPSLQAERLKKHLKKFAIASPVKSNPKNKRLIAKALAQGMSVSKAKEKQEPSTATRISTKPHCYTGLMQTQPTENHSKVAANTKNPASARILRKYSNMREKMQVQQNTLKSLKSSLKKKNKISVTPKIVSKETPTGRGQKSAIVKKVKALSKKAKAKSVVKERTPKGVVSRALRGLKARHGVQTKKALSKASKTNPVTESKTSCKKEIVAKNLKSLQTKADIKKSPSTKSLETLPPATQAVDVKVQISEDQVLTRSQRKNEATLAQSGSPKTATKRGGEPSPTLAKRTRTSK